MHSSLQNVSRPFFIGIGGIGISAIARMFLHEGKQVSGIDIAESAVTKELVRAGAHIAIVPPDKQTQSCVPHDADAVIYSIAIENAAPDFFAALKTLSIPVFSYPQTLEILSREKYTIAISGTHGKTTTTAMIASILVDAGFDPTVIVGSLMPRTGSNFIAGNSKYFVVEACEYRRSFLQIHPTIAVVLNIDEDHLDYYKDIEDIKRAFHSFVERVPSDGYVVGNTMLPHIREVFSGVSSRVIDTASNTSRILLQVPGGHNQFNARTALSVAKTLGISEEKARKSLSEFSGTWRRFERKGVTSTGVLVYDDYAHHPAEITATISGARELYPDKRLTVIFQPHLFSRTKQHLEAFAESLSAADRVYVADIYPARELFDPTISSRDIVSRLTNQGIEAYHEPDFSRIVTSVHRSTTPRDLVITMGAGETNQIAERLVLESH